MSAGNGGYNQPWPGASAPINLAIANRSGLLSKGDYAKLQTIAATRSEVQVYQAANTAVAHGTPIAWVFSNEQVDALNEFNPATGVYTAHHACDLLITGHFQLINPPDQQLILILLYDGTGASLLLRMASATKSGPTTAPSGDLSAPFAGFVSVAAGGTLAVKYQSGNVAASAQTMRGGADAAWLRFRELV